MIEELKKIHSEMVKTDFSINQLIDIRKIPEKRMYNLFVEWVLELNAACLKFQPLKSEYLKNRVNDLNLYFDSNLPQDLPLLPRLIRLAYRIEGKKETFFSESVTAREKNSLQVSAVGLCSQLKDLETYIGNKKIRHTEKRLTKKLGRTCSSMASFIDRFLEYQHYQSEKNSRNVNARFNEKIGKKKKFRRKNYRKEDLIFFEQVLGNIVLPKEKIFESVKEESSRFVALGVIALCKNPCEVPLIFKGHRQKLLSIQNKLKQVEAKVTFLYPILDQLILGIKLKKLERVAVRHFGLSVLRKKIEQFAKDFSSDYPNIIQGLLKKLFSS